LAAITEEVFMYDSAGERYDKLRSDLKALTEDVEELIDASADQTNEGLGSLARRVRQTLESARRSLAEEERVLRVRWAHGAKKTAAYIQHRPWSVTGAGVGAVTILGLLIWRQLTNVK
jgi:ElaB/YqjD/DUF883 family membrane-anchored ribosome-binding protein